MHCVETLTDREEMQRKVTKRDAGRMQTNSISVAKLTTEEDSALETVPAEFRVLAPSFHPYSDVVRRPFAAAKSKGRLEAKSRTNGVVLRHPFYSSLKD